MKFPESAMIWSLVSSAGVAPLCFIKSRSSLYQESLENYMLLSADKLYGDDDFLFQQNVAPAHCAKTTGNWFVDHSITVLDWPAEPLYISMGYCHKEETPDRTMLMS